MAMKSFWDRALFYLTVPKCVCCREKLDIEDIALCAECLREYENIKLLSDCSRCARIMQKCLCVNDYLDRHYVHKLVKIFRYRRPEGPNDRIPSNELIYNIKRGYRRDLLEFIVSELEIALNNSIDCSGYIITNVPRKRSRALKYGIDHSEKIAKALSARLGIEYVKLLYSTSRKPQKKTFGVNRISNATFDYYKRLKDVKGRKILLLDDIVTTGASMGNCAMLIKGLGVKEIVGVCISVAYKDKIADLIRGRNKKARA